jgi:hypothetical protein
MKKLSLIISISIIFSANSIIPAESSNVMKTIATRFEALKQYLFKKEEAPIQQTVVAPEPLMETPKTVPIIVYHPTSPWKPAHITLIKAANNNQKININKLPTKQFNNISSYNLSPKKQYLLIEQNLTEKSKNGMFKKMLGEQGNVSYKTKLINAITQQEITSFNNRAIMYTFSPEETTMLIATIQQPQRGFFKKGSDPKGASQSKLKEQKLHQTNRILRYNLFDINTKTILKTFENIKLITYLADNKLFVEYDNGAMENITIEEKELSFFDIIINLFNKKPPLTIQTTSTITSNFGMETGYDAEKEILSLKPNKEIKKQYESRSFHLSPENKYILIQQFNKTSLLIELQHGKIIATFQDLITYEFNEKENEDRLLVLCKKQTDPSIITEPSITTNSSGYLYQLYDITKEDTEPITFDKTTQSAYFIPSQKLMVIDKLGNPILYDAITKKKQEPSLLKLDENPLTKE